MDIRNTIRGLFLSKKRKEEILLANLEYEREKWEEMKRSYEKLHLNLFAIQSQQRNFVANAIREHGLTEEQQKEYEIHIEPIEKSIAENEKEYEELQARMKLYEENFKAKEKFMLDYIENNLRKKRNNKHKENIF